jgi:hypothetical protein
MDKDDDFEDEPVEQPQNSQADKPKGKAATSAPQLR